MGEKTKTEVTKFLMSPEPLELPDLSPAQWIWYPTTRAHQNTFVLFRRTIELDQRPVRATGWIVGESRYRLEVNGRRVQWGPAPCDPRHTEVDPVDLTELLVSGGNVIGAAVCFFGGLGDGTWPTGKPGFLFRLELIFADGSSRTVASDGDWRAHLCRAWPPGHFRRNFFRSLQEAFDARRYPYGWTEAGFEVGSNWRPAMPLSGSPNRPAVFTEFFESNSWIRATGEGRLRPRSIPMLKEERIPVERLAESARLHWRIPAEEYFELMTNGVLTADSHSRSGEAGPANPAECFEVAGRNVVRTDGKAGEWSAQVEPGHAITLIFVLKEQMVGFPYFTIEAPEGTVVEVLTQEGHEIGGPALLQTGMNSWARFICREGTNTFESFEYESLRWLQLHIHGCAERFRIRDVGLRRRLYPWPHKAVVRTSEKPLQRLFDACVNSLNSNCQETVVDGVGRERQQYGGDAAHQLHGVRMALGGDLLSRRYLSTLSQGMTTSGYFLDCWPGNDRLIRAGQRHLNLFHFGTILDHGVQLFFECFHHYMHTADLEALREPFPRFLRFAGYLMTTLGEDGMLKVEDLGLPFVWLDYEAYHQRSGAFPHFTQRRKKCAYNLYVAAAFRKALAPVCRWFGEEEKAVQFEVAGRRLEERVVEHFWSRSKRIFIDNLPWLEEEGEEFYSDRALATAVLFGQCPENDTAAAVKMLADRPANLGISFVANAGWRLWALAKGCRADIILREYRDVWATSRAVIENNGMPEVWEVGPDTGAQWNFCASAPLYVAFQGLAGIRPLEPGYRRVEIRPQLGDIPDLDLAVRSPHGTIGFKAVRNGSGHHVRIELPPGVIAELVLRPHEGLSFEKTGPAEQDGLQRYRMPGKRTCSFSTTAS